MKATQRLVLVPATLSLLGAVACQPQSNEPASPSVKASVASVVGVGAAAACGVAPAGELVAEAIAGAKTSRTEPSLYEGPVWIKDALYFSDFVTTGVFPSRIQKLDANGLMSTFIDDSGSNGLAVDAAGNIVAGTHKYKSVSRYSMAGERTTLADQYAGNVFNSPNDIAIAKDGTLYFTDPAFQRDAAAGGQAKTGVYRRATDGSVTLVDDTIANPNGVSLALDEKTLYVNGGGEQGVLRAYPVVDGIPQAGKDLLTGLSIPDGMTLDCHGNIYITEHLAQRVRVISPQGQALASIKLDANVTNAAFGGLEGKTLFLTGAGVLWQVKLDVTGQPY